MAKQHSELQRGHSTHRLQSEFALINREPSQSRMVWVPSPRAVALPFTYDCLRTVLNACEQSHLPPKWLAYSWDLCKVEMPSGVRAEEQWPVRSSLLTTH